MSSTKNRNSRGKSAPARAVRGRRSALPTGEENTSAVSSSEEAPSAVSDSEAPTLDELMARSPPEDGSEAERAAASEGAAESMSAADPASATVPESAAVPEGDAAPGDEALADGDTAADGEDPAGAAEDAPEDAFPAEDAEDAESSRGVELAGEGIEFQEGEAENTEEFLKGLVEAILFTADHPLSAKDVARAARIDKRRAQELIEILTVETRNRGVRVVEVADGFAYRTNPAYGSPVRDFLAQKPVRLSRAQLETLAIVAYRQPVTRPEVDDIRGVDSGAVLKTLLERDLLRILGKKDEPGRPMIYGTTPQFLDLFSLKSLRDLPTLREFTELSEDSRAKFELELGEAAPEGPLPVAEILKPLENQGADVAELPESDSEGPVSEDEESASDSEEPVSDNEE